MVIASHLCTAVGNHQFRKESRKRQRRIMFERNYSLFPSLSVVLSLLMFQKQYFELTKTWAQAAIRECTAPLAPRSDGTA